MPDVAIPSGTKLVKGDGGFFSPIRFYRSLTLVDTQLDYDPKDNETTLSWLYPLSDSIRNILKSDARLELHGFGTNEPMQHRACLCDRFIYVNT